MPPAITNTIMPQNVTLLIYSHHIFLLKGDGNEKPPRVSHRGFERRLRGWGAGGLGVSPFKGNNAALSLLFHNKKPRAPPRGA